MGDAEGDEDAAAALAAALATVTAASPSSASPSSCGRRKSWRTSGAWRRERGSSSGGAGAGSTASGLWSGSGNLGGIPSSASPPPRLGGASSGNSGSLGGYGAGSFGSGSSGGVVDLGGMDQEKFLAASFVVLRVGWAGAGRLALEATGFGVTVSPPPAPGLPPIFELPTLRCTGPVSESEVPRFLSFSVVVGYF